MPVEGRGLSSRQTQYVVKDLGDWATYKLHDGFKNCRRRRTPNKGVRSCPRAGCGNGAMVEPLRHRQTKGAANGYVQPKTTAPHLDSTKCCPCDYVVSTSG